MKLRDYFKNGVPVRPEEGMALCELLLIAYDEIDDKTYLINALQRKLAYYEREPVIAPTKDWG